MLLIYGLYKFNFCIYEYFTYDSKTVRGGALIRNQLR